MKVRSSHLARALIYPAKGPSDGILKSEHRNCMVLAIDGSGCAKRQRCRQALRIDWSKYEWRTSVQGDFLEKSCWRHEGLRDLIKNLGRQLRTEFHARMSIQTS